MRPLRHFISIITALLTMAGFATAEQGFFTEGPSISDGLVNCQSFYKEGTKCRELTATFAYSKNGLGWEAPAGTITDGASIPVWAQWFIGQPFSEEFGPASILHDHYVRAARRPYLMTQRMFYDALIDTGVDPVKAGTMYAAIIVGGAAWTVQADGKKCDLVSNCVRSIQGLLDLPAINLVESSYDKIDMELLTREFWKRIETENLTPEDIEAFALRARIIRGIKTPLLVKVVR